MATTPITPATTPAVSTPADIQTELLAQVRALSTHHVTVSYTLIGVLLVVLALASFGGWLGLKAYDHAIARAEAAEAKYDADEKSWAATLAQHDAQRAADAQQEAQLLAQIASRDKQAPPLVIQAGLKPDATAQQAALALGAAAGGQVAPTVTQDNRIAVMPVESQEITLDLLAGTKAEGDLKDTQSLLDLKNKDNTSLSNDLAQCKTENTEANKVITQYKKAAKRSKFRSFLNGTEKVGLLVLGGYIGHTI